MRKHGSLRHNNNLAGSAARGDELPSALATQEPPRAVGILWAVLYSNPFSKLIASWRARKAAEVATLMNCDLRGGEDRSAGDWPLPEVDLRAAQPRLDRLPTAVAHIMEAVILYGDDSPEHRASKREAVEYIRSGRENF